MFAIVVQNLRLCWQKLLLADLVFKAIAFILIAPAVSIVFRTLLAISGRQMLADADIAKFLLHPVGLGSFLLFSAILISIFAIELAILMTLSIAAHLQQPISIRGAMHFIAAGHTTQVLRLAMRVVAELVLWAIPFLAAGGALFWFLLTDHDINFYLAEKPPKFWVAIGCIGTCLLAGAAVLLWRIANYIFATQILIFEDASPREALQISSRRAAGHRVRIAISLCVWAGLNMLLGLLLNFVIGFAGREIITTAAGSMWALVFAVGTAIGLVTLGNVVSGAISNATLGSLLAMAYVKYGRSEESIVDLPRVQQQETLGGIKVTPMRAAITLVAAVAIAGFFGRLVLNSFDLEDDVVITAHRGGAIPAPENTIAAIERAIQDQADWIEIDVQESKDGVVLVVHDSDLKKVGGPATKIWEATAAELQQIDIGSYHGSQFSDQRVPTLDDVLKLCQNRVKVNIELKYYGHTQELESKVVKIVEENGMQDEIVIMSLKQSGLDKIKELRPEWTCGLLTAVSAGDLTKAQADFLAVNAGLATRSFINRAHAAGKDVAAWTLNDAYSLSLMISRGADNLITDDPALARQVLAERAALSPVDRISLELAFYFGVKPKSFEQ